MLVDFLAILPYYLVILGVDLRVMRALRLFRIVRLLKIARYSSALQTLGRVLLKSKGELGMCFFAMVVLLILASSLMFYAERDVQPELFSSIPAAMWWGMATLTTVGYGDIYPLTPFGKLLGSFIAVLGVAMFALPAGILGAAFSGELHKDDETVVEICPHCGKTID
jgi:voltage-gated potassium channel